MAGIKTRKRKKVLFYGVKVNNCNDNWFYHWKEYTIKPNMKFLSPSEKYISEQIGKTAKMNTRDQKTIPKPPRLTNKKNGKKDLKRT